MKAGRRIRGGKQYEIVHIYDNQFSWNPKSLEGKIIQFKNIYKDAFLCIKFHNEMYVSLTKTHLN